MRVPLAEGAEFDLIRRFLAGAASGGRSDVRLGPGDDCAVVAGGAIAISTDASVEGVHFRRAWIGPGEVGWRAASAALSDLAAVGARPIGALVSVLVPPADAATYAAEVMEGVRGAVEAIGGVLLGGDVTESPQVFAMDVVAVGETASPVRRSGARPGDALWVSGRLGGAAAAVAAWLRGAEPEASAREAFAHPHPRTAEALWLLDRLPVHAMIDLSDGLAGDAEQIAVASGVSVVLEADAVPLHGSIAPLPHGEALRLALGGGEDYELCFAASEGDVAPHVDAFRARFGLDLTCVGRIEAGGRAAVVRLRGRDGEEHPLPMHGFRHFARRGGAEAAAAGGSGPAGAPGGGGERAGGEEG